MALMNPKIKEEEEEVRQMQTDVTDQEMALRYRPPPRNTGSCCHL